MMKEIYKKLDKKTMKSTNYSIVTYKRNRKEKSFTVRLFKKHQFLGFFCQFFCLSQKD